MASDGLKSRVSSQSLKVLPACVRLPLRGPFWGPVCGCFRRDIDETGCQEAACRYRRLIAGGLNRSRCRRSGESAGGPSCRRFCDVGDRGNPPMSCRCLCRHNPASNSGPSRPSCRRRCCHCAWRCRWNWPLTKQRICRRPAAHAACGAAADTAVAGHQTGAVRRRAVGTGTVAAGLTHREC